MTNEELWALMPEGADSPDIHGAVVTATFFLEQFGPTVQTGDTTVWEELSTDECDFCLVQAKWVTDNAAAELTQEGGALTPSSPPAEAELIEAGRAAVVLRVDEEATRILDVHGTVEDEWPATTLRVGMVLSFDGERWYVENAAAEPWS